MFTVNSFLDFDYVELLRAARGASGTVLPVAHLPHLRRIVVMRGHAPTRCLGWNAHGDTSRSVSSATAIHRARSVRPDDLSDILFTSETTGSPKGVMTTHRQNPRAFAAWTEVVGLCAADRYLIVNPFFSSFRLQSRMALRSPSRGYRTSPRRL